MRILVLTQNIIPNLLHSSTADLHAANEVIIFRFMMDLLCLATAETAVLFRTALTAAGACIKHIFVEDLQAQCIKFIYFIMICFYYVCFSQGVLA